MKYSSNLKKKIVDFQLLISLRMESEEFLKVYNDFNKNNFKMN